MIKDYKKQSDILNLAKGQIISKANLLVLNSFKKNEPKTSAPVTRAEFVKYLVHFLEESRSR